MIRGGTTLMMWRCFASRGIDNHRPESVASMRVVGVVDVVLEREERERKTSGEVTESTA